MGGIIIHNSQKVEQFKCSWTCDGKHYVIYLPTPNEILNG